MSSVSLHFYLLEINFVHLESCLEDPWSQYSAPQQILKLQQKCCEDHKDTLEDLKYLRPKI